MNKFTFTGRLTADPEILRTQDGKPVVRYRFAVNRTFKREGEPEADYFTIAMFGNSAERFEKLNVTKGTKLLIEGDVRNNNYTDKNGNKHYDFQFVANTFEFCESKQNQQTAPATSYNQAPAYTQAPAPAQDENGFMFVPDDVSDEGLPFV